MRNITNTQVIDLPAMVENVRETVELSSVRLTTCLKGINRMREMIQDKAFFEKQGNSKQEIFELTSEMELLIEKAYSLIDEFYAPSIEALDQTQRFLTSFSD